MHCISVFERLRQDTLSKKESFIGYLEIMEQMSKQIYIHGDLSEWDIGPEHKKYLRLLAKIPHEN